MYIISALIGAVYVFLLVLAKPDLSETELYVALALLFVCLYLHIIIHEFGHYIFGRFSGYTFTSFRVGSLLLMKENGQLVRKKYSLPGTMGQCLMRPPKFDNGNFPIMLYNFGGGIFNLIIAAVAFLFYIKTDFADIFFYAMIFIGVLLTLSNLIPLNLKIPNDGYNALHLNGNKAAKLGFWLSLETNAVLSEGKKLQEMPEELFETPSDADMNNHYVATIPYLKISRLLEQENLDGALKLFNEIKKENGFLDIYSKEIEAEFLGFDIMNGKINHKSEVKEELIKYLKSSVFLLNHLRILYSFFKLIENDKKNAEIYRQKYYKLAPKFPYKSIIEAENKFMQLIENK